MSAADVDIVQRPNADLLRTRGEDLARLIADYDRPGPRYTSYPPAPAWSEDFGAADFEAALARVGSRVSVYVHVPFCESLCTYCACNREISRDPEVADPYLEALELEAERVRGALPHAAECVQLALGGGTPTFLDPARLERLLDIVDARFPPAAGAERSIEVDPRVTTEAQIELLARRGFNRLSLGVQDLSPRVQRAIHRIQSREVTEALVATAREQGFASVNLDLIYGLPYQTLDSFDETLDQVLEMAPDRVALYSYAHVTWVSKQQRGFERKDLPGPAEKVQLFVLALRRMLQAGYRFIGLDHFARPDDELARALDRGDLNRNFMGYTTHAGVDLLALGPSGISECGDAYAQSLRGSREWEERLRAGQLATLRGWWLTDEDRKRRWLIRRLMCQGEVDAMAYADAFGEGLHELLPGLATRLLEFEDDGLLERTASGHRVTTLGQLFLRPMAMAFDATLAPVAEGPRYSRTV